MEDYRIKIFLVDDDPLYLKTLQVAFEKSSDFDITTFTNGEDCLEHLSTKPDIIVLDYTLNSKNKDAQNGYDILVKIKEIDPDIHVIILSSTEDVEMALSCIKYNAFNFILKNDTAFLRLKHSIKQIFHIHSKVKELIVWDW